MSNFMKLRAVGTELFHMDGRTYRQTDMTKLTAAFVGFAYAPKIARKVKFFPLQTRCGPEGG